MKTEHNFASWARLFINIYEYENIIMPTRVSLSLSSLYVLFVVNNNVYTANFNYANFRHSFLI